MAKPKYDPGVFYTQTQCVCCQESTRRCGWFPRIGWKCWKCCDENRKPAAGKGDLVPKPRPVKATRATKNIPEKKTRKR